MASAPQIARTRNGVSTRASIEKEALRLFAQKGVEGTTIRDLALAVGVADAALYRYFTSKEDIAADLFATHYGALARSIEEIGARAAPFAETIAALVDLLIGVVPITNLEWIQKIARDNAERGYSAEATVDTILRRMPDYINHICPQFSRTDINFQRVSTVDTSNPFMIRPIPSPDESFVIIHFRKGAREKWGIDFTYLLNMIQGSFMSSPTSIVVNGGKMGFAMELILTPIIHRMVEDKKLA